MAFTIIDEKGTITTGGTDLYTATEKSNVIAIIIANPNNVDYDVELAVESDSDSFILLKVSLDAGDYIHFSNNILLNPGDKIHGISSDDDVTFILRGDTNILDLEQQQSLA